VQCKEHEFLTVIPVTDEMVEQARRRREDREALK